MTIHSSIKSKLSAKISDTQKQNIKTLIADIQASVEGAPSDSSLTALKTEVKTAWSDRSITRAEVKAIAYAVIDVVESAGISAAEARTIFYDLQDIAETSRLPKTNDTAVGTEGNDTLWTGLGNDTLTGTSGTGVGEIDWLCGGGGKDTFVLGNSTQAFYDDGQATTAGLSDYALILDFNRKQDTIQLHGSASDYIAAALPSSVGIAGTGLYYKTGNAVPELVGVIAGITVTDLSTGFSFV